MIKIEIELQDVTGECSEKSYVGELKSGTMIYIENTSSSPVIMVEGYGYAVPIDKIARAVEYEHGRRHRLLKRGTQVIYVPSHALGDTSHPDCERGFVTSQQGNIVWVRYWHRDRPELRTTTCSERTARELLVVKNTVPKVRVEQALERIQREEHGL